MTRGMDDRPGGTPVLRRLNTATVLSIARAAAPAALRIGELMERSGLARPTVSQVVEGLVAEGLLQEHPPDGTGPTMGRPAARYSLRGAAAYVVGIDIGPHTVAASVTDIAGRERALVRRSVAGQAPHATAVNTAVDAVIDESLATAGVSGEQLGAVVAATPGLVDPATGPRLAPSIPGWAGLDLVTRLTERFACPVTVDNDANLSAVAIAAARGHSHGAQLIVQWGERLGSGIVIDGRLHRGASGAAGEIGFITVDGVPRPPDPLGRGPLEHAIGAEAIGRLGRAVGAETPESAFGRALSDADESDVVSTVFAIAASGDDDARRVVDTVAGIFARAIAPVVLALDPDAVVIGGGVARAGQVLADSITEQLGALTLSTPTIELSPLAQDAVVRGAVHLALEEVWKRYTPAG